MSVLRLSMLYSRQRQVDRRSRFRRFNGARLNGQIAVRRGNPRGFVRTTSDTTGTGAADISRGGHVSFIVNSELAVCNRRDLVMNVARSSVMFVALYLNASFQAIAP